MAFITGQECSIPITGSNRQVFVFWLPGKRRIDQVPLVAVKGHIYSCYV